MGIKMNQSQFGRHLGCSQQNISKHIKSGVIQIENKKIDVDKAMESLKNYGLLDDQNKLKKRTTKKNDDKKEERNFHQVTSELPLEGEVPYESFEYLTAEEIEQKYEDKVKHYDELQKKTKQLDLGSKNINTSPAEEVKYADAKAHRENFMGKIAELDYQIKISEYVLKAEVEQTFFEAARVIRDSLLNYPNKMALRVVGKTDIKDIENILMEEIQIILGNLSNES